MTTDPITTQTNLNSEQMVLTDKDPFDAIIIQMVKVNRAKRADYASGHPLGNFFDSAQQLGLTAGHSVETLIATKQARLKTLLPKLWIDPKSGPVNEPIEDTLLDRAVYSVLALWIWQEGHYEKR